MSRTLSFLACLLTLTALAEPFGIHAPGGKSQPTRPTNHEYFTAYNDGKEAATLPKKEWRPILGKKLFFEIDKKGRRVIVSSKVVVPNDRGRSFPLELLLTGTDQKEHESLLATDVPAKMIHTFLLAANAKQGKPVQFLENKTIPASGSPLKITLMYEDNGKIKSIPAQEWIAGGPKPEWVFGGSRVVRGTSGKKHYLADNDGDYISVSNFDTSMIDLNAVSSAKNSERQYRANYNGIPKHGTQVWIVIEPTK